MNKKTVVSFSDPKQDRSKQTLENILEAAYEIVESADPEVFTSRSLARKSGYSLGTLTRRLSSIENVFFWAIQKGREAHFQKLADSFSLFDPNLPVEKFVEAMVNQSFSGIGKVGPKVMRYYDDRFTKKNGLPADYFNYVDVVIEPYQKLCSRDRTNTFRMMTRDEAWFSFRAVLPILERPFAQGDLIAGTEEHRRISIELITRLLAK